MAQGEKSKRIFPLYIKAELIKENCNVVDLCEACERVSGHGSIDGATLVNRLWRVLPFNEVSRAKLLTNGIRLFGKDLKFEGLNPFLHPSGEGETQTTKLIIKNLPFSYDQSAVERNLINAGFKLRGKMQWMKGRKRSTGHLSDFRDGRRSVFVDLPTWDVNPFMRMGTFRAKIEYAEMKKVCYRCLQEGHTARDCTNEEVCRSCKKPGHRKDECPGNVVEKANEGDQMGRDPDNTEPMKTSPSAGDRDATSQGIDGSLEAGDDSGQGRDGGEGESGMGPGVASDVGTGGVSGEMGDDASPDDEGEEAGPGDAPAEVLLGEEESRGGSSCERPPVEAEMEDHSGPSVEGPPGVPEAAGHSGPSVEAPPGVPEAAGHEGLSVGSQMGAECQSDMSPTPEFINVQYAELPVKGQCSVKGQGPTLLLVKKSASMSALHTAADTPVGKVAQRNPGPKDAEKNLESVWDTEFREEELISAAKIAEQEAEKHKGDLASGFQSGASGGISASDEVKHSGGASTRLFSAGKRAFRAIVSPTEGKKESRVPKSKKTNTNPKKK